MLNWKRNDGARSAAPAALADHPGACCALGCWASWLRLGQVLAAGGLALGLLLIAGAVAIPARYWKISSSLGGDLGRFLRATPLAVWGMTLAHAGLGVTAIGITAVTAWQTSKVLEMRWARRWNWRARNTRSIPSASAMAPIIRPTRRASP